MKRLVLLALCVAVLLVPGLAAQAMRVVGQLCRLVTGGAGTP
jgi:hypothetical protein